MLQLDSKALYQKDTKANRSPFLMSWTFDSPFRRKGWVLWTNFSPPAKSICKYRRAGLPTVRQVMKNLG